MVGVVALLLVVSAGAFALSGGSAEKTASPNSSGMPQGQQTSEGTAPRPDTPHADSPQPQAMIDPGAGASGANGVKPQSGSGSEGPAATRDVEVADEGAELAVVRSAPTKTISRLKVPDDFTPTRFELKFQPYGWAPEGSEGKRLVARITVWEPSAGAPVDIKDLTGQNALFSVESYEGQPISAGGTYEGSVEVRASDDGRGTLNLISAKAAR